jgi:hypothetical protein
MRESCRRFVSIGDRHRYVGIVMGIAPPSICASGINDNNSFTPSSNQRRISSMDAAAETTSAKIDT